MTTLALMGYGRTNERSVATYRSFDDFYRQEYKNLVGLGYVLTGSNATAQDLAQQAFTEAHRNWAKISTYDRPGAWTRRVLINKSRSRFRRATTELKALTRIANQRQLPIEVEPQTDEIWHAVRSLPKRQAQAIALKYWDELSVAEISRVLECSEETVKTHLKRGRATLAERLKDVR